MSNESTQPFDINEHTAEPSHRPKHDRGRRESDERVHNEEADRPSSTTAPTGDAQE